MDVDISDLKEIDSVSLEKETCKKFDELRFLQEILKWLTPKIREKNKDHSKYTKFYDNIKKIIKFKLNHESIVGGECELNYELVNGNKIIIDNEELIISDITHEQNEIQAERTKNKNIGNLEIVVFGEENVVKLEENRFIPLNYYNKLYSHQKRALSWLVKLDCENLGGILADDMGLGKTITLLSLINCIVYSSYVNKSLMKESSRTFENRTQHSNNLPNKNVETEENEDENGESKITRILIWKNEIDKWIFKGVKYYILHSNYLDTCYTVENNLDYVSEPPFLIYLIGYEYLRINIENVNSYKWHYLILDEGQKIRNPNSLTSLSVKTIKTTHRIILSGSPIQNNLVELWSLIDFIIPNYLGSLSSFVEDFVIPINNAKYESNKYMNKLKLLILPYIFRTVKSNKSKNTLFNSLVNPIDVDSNTPTRVESEGSCSSGMLPSNLNSKETDGLSTNEGYGVVSSNSYNNSLLNLKDDQENSGMMTNNEIDLPNKKERIILCNLTMEQYKLYVGVLNKFNYIIRDRFETKGGFNKDFAKTMNKELNQDKNILRLISILRKICNHPKMLDSRYINKYFYPNDCINGSLTDSVNRSPSRNLTSLLNSSPYRFNLVLNNQLEISNLNGKNTQSPSRRRIESAGSSKLNVSLKIIEMWKKENKKILLFTQTTTMLNIIYDHLLEIYDKDEILILFGKHTVSNRNKIIERFSTDDKVFIMILTTKVGGIGLNLTAATRIIIYDPDWNPMTDMQAKERCYRIGQKNEVIIYRLITASTIEEKIYQRQLYKYYLSQQILSHNNSFYNKYINNLQYLITYPKPPIVFPTKSPVESSSSTPNSTSNIVMSNTELSRGVDTNLQLNQLCDQNEDQKGDEIYHLINNNENISSFINYNDVNLPTENEYSFLRSHRRTRKPCNIDGEVKKNKLLFNLKRNNNKNLTYIITDHIMNYFKNKNNKSITTEKVCFLYSHSFFS
uniref:DNA repair helicase, putative n=1 Tax=Theileria annulata TaxID=5874 RepID=A0A3B0MUY9_THEAN